uniref:Uncharacterized protein n=1 Tax=Rhizophora mucronata TaxID=61149 RepID=A0A2P2PEP2_RHIMU
MVLFIFLVMWVLSFGLQALTHPTHTPPAGLQNKNGKIE